MTIHYVVGDATKHPEVKGKVIVAHITNNFGWSNHGFVAAVEAAWPGVGYTYDIDPEAQVLGRTQIVVVEKDKYVANMCAQNNGSEPGLELPRPRRAVDYVALKRCLTTVAKFAKKEGCTIVGPHFGTGIGGGKLEEIVELIEANCKGVDVWLYEFQDTKAASYVPDGETPWYPDADMRADFEAWYDRFMASNRH